MNPKSVFSALRAGVLLCPAFLVSTILMAQTQKPVIWLAPGDAPNVANHAPTKGEASFANAPANFHAFASARVGEDSYPERVTLRFEASTQLTKIESTRDFQLEPESSCAEGKFYSAGDSCILVVRFTPQGPGRRLGTLKITHTGSAQPLAVGLGGNGYAPVLSFTPAVITTVPGTFPSSKGLLNGAQNLTVDGGDALYIADTGNKVIRFMDSSGVIKTLTTTATNPLGIAVGNLGEVYFDEPMANTMHEIYEFGQVVQISGSVHTVGCSASAPCDLSSVLLSTPGTMSIDASNQLFFIDANQGAAVETGEGLIFLYDPFGFVSIVADASDNIYTSGPPVPPYSYCYILSESLYDTENDKANFTKMVGGRTCGFSGDGGQAENAEIGTVIRQMAFDLAGNLYFSDTSNQRVRRVDAVTGIINTIAGTGTAGYNGDGGQATSAALSSPTGVAVDSQGQVYIISGAAATGTAQVVRKLGPNGFLNFGGQLRNSTGAAHLVTVANTGNSAMTITSARLIGANPGDFSIDPNTTSCLLTPGSYLYSGQSCKIGFLFRPLASGVRQANFVFLGNTVTNSNTVQLLGVGTLPAPTFTITSPAASTSIKAGTAVTFAVSVTSTTSPVPTGKVTMLLDGAAISGSPATLNASGVASLSVITSVTGTHTLSATYTGDTNYAAVGPITRTYAITAAAVAITSPTTGTSVKSGTATKFAVSVTSLSSPAPTGTVAFKVDSTALGSVALSSGVASVNVTLSTTGTHTLSATYSGDTNYAAAGPITRTYTVAAAAVTKVTLSSTANPVRMCHPATFSAPLTFTAPVTFSVLVVGQGAEQPAGKVELRKGSTVLASAELNNGTARLTTFALTMGMNPLTAHYEGDAQNAAATSAVLEQMVMRVGTCSIQRPVRPSGQRGSAPQ